MKLKLCEEHCGAAYLVYKRSNQNNSFNEVSTAAVIFHEIKATTTDTV